MKLQTVAIAAIALFMSGCATKQYGRLTPLSSYEMANYTCRDINIELSKIDAFDASVKEQAHFDAKSALGILGDYGIGNAMAKGSAEKSSTARRKELNMLAAQKNCSVPPVAN